MLSNFDQADLCSAMSSEQLVSVSTIYGHLIKVLVHPGMPVVDFKDKCFEEDLWHSSPIGLCTPLAINRDLAAMMSEGQQVTDPSPWKELGRYNRFMMCSCAHSWQHGEHANILPDDGVLQQDVLTDSKLFKVQWVKQFNLRVQEKGMLLKCQLQPVECFNVPVNNHTLFLAFPLYGPPPGLFVVGLVYQHSDTQGHYEYLQLLEQTQEEEREAKKRKRSLDQCDMCIPPCVPARECRHPPI